MENIKVLQVLLDSHIGGPQQRALQAALRLRENGFSTIFCVPRGWGPFKEVAQKNGFLVYDVLPPQPPWPRNLRRICLALNWLIRLPKITKSLANIIANQDIDIVHVNGFLGWHAALAAKIAKKPLIYHVMGTMYPKWLVHMTYLVWASPSAKIIATAEEVAKFYLGKRNCRCLVLYDPVDLTYFCPDHFPDTARMDFRRELGLNEKDKFGVVVANVNPAKGLEFLIEALPFVMKQGWSVHIAIVGLIPKTQEKYYAKLLQLIKIYSLDRYVMFLGSREDIPQILGAADFFVLPSVTEGTPMAILEAMAMALPVVATDVGAISELIGDSERGILVSPKDALALAQAISNILSHPETAKTLGEKARQWVVTHCSLEKYTQELVKLYYEVWQSRSAITAKRKTKSGEGG